jgi:4-diphosphocytidyl-2-C-methyl-D-erythritol kinase
MGAGLGGGSSDGSYMLKLLNKLFQLGLSEKKLINYAAQLGSDCTFFILNQACHASGRGEILDPLEIDLSAYRFLLVYPNIHIRTSWAFTQVSPHSGNNDLKKMINRPITEWKTGLFNDFDEPVLKKYPELKIIKKRLYESGAIYASLSGSGSVIYGIFQENTIQQNPVFPGCKTWLI